MNYIGWLSFYHAFKAKYLSFIVKIPKKTAAFTLLFVFVRLVETNLNVVSDELFIFEKGI